VVSRENSVVVSFVTAGLVVTYAGAVLTDLSDTLLIGVLLFVGVVAPQLVNSYLDERDAE